MIMPTKVIFRSDDADVHDEIYKMLSHVHAQTLLICGEGMENFLCHSDEVKSNYLWSLCDLAERFLSQLAKLGRKAEVITDE